MTCSELPNFFLMNGPNTNLPHTSVLLVSEANARYIVDLIKQVSRDTTPSDTAYADLPPWTKEHFTA